MKSTLEELITNSVLVNNQLIINPVCIHNGNPVIRIATNAGTGFYKIYDNSLVDFDHEWHSLSIASV